MNQISNDRSKLSKWWRYPLSTITGVVITTACVFMGVQLTSLFGPSSETGYAGSLFGALIGFPIGGFVSGRTIRSIVRPSLRWLQITFVSPGVWIALMILGLQATHFGMASDYLKELIAPCIVAIILSLCGTYKGIYLRKGKKRGL